MKKKNPPAPIDPQYGPLFEQYEQLGPVVLGVHTSHFWRSDPRHLGIMLARYKFVAKMLSGYKNVLEVGCGDGFGSAVVLQEVPRVHGIDVDLQIIAACRSRAHASGLSYEVWDIGKKPLPARYDAAYAIDVLEHVPRKKEPAFLRNMVRSISPRGVCIIGTPSKESQAYASYYSRIVHVNCKSGKELKACMRNYFEHVFIFSMNDEVVHTGFYPMAHYLWALCVQPRSSVSKTKR